MVLIVTLSLTGCVSDDQRSNTWSLPQGIDFHTRLGRGLSARGFLERYLEQGSLALGSLLLVVNSQKKFRSDSLLHHYAYQLRKSCPDSLVVAELKQLVSGTRDG